MYDHTMGPMSRSSFMKPASISGASYGFGDTMWVLPRENEYSKKWNMLKNLPGERSIWSPKKLGPNVKTGSHSRGAMGLPRDDRVVHDWLIRFLGEVAFPAWAKAFHVLLLHFILGGPDFDTCFNAIGGHWTSAIHVPLVKDLLNLWITRKKSSKLSVSGLTRYLEKVR